MSYIINFRKFDSYDRIYSVDEKRREYEVVKYLGKGQYGIVYKAVDTKYYNSYAIKISSIKKSTNVNEVDVYLRLIGVNNYDCYFPKIYGIYQSSTHYFIVMKYIKRGKLDTSLIDRYKLGFSDIRLIIFNILMGLKIIHELGLVFNDLKPENILVDKIDGKIKPVIVDMGFVYNRNEQLTKYYTGTPYFMPKEVFMSVVSGDKKDVWALGMTIHEFIFGYIPSKSFIMYADKKERDIVFRDNLYFVAVQQMKNDYKVLEQYLGQNEAELMRDFVLNCIIKEHHIRPTVEQLLDHHIFKRD
jgi:serine/threonine protein kinase